MRGSLFLEGMKRVAIIGNAGGGKSTLARELATASGLPLHVLDKIQYLPGGTAVPHEGYLQAHAALLESDVRRSRRMAGRQSGYPKYHE